MRKTGIVLLLILSFVFCAVTAEELGPWVTEENAREVASRWIWEDKPCQWTAGAQKDFMPMRMEPEAAYKKLLNAYQEKEEEGTKETLDAWGVDLEAKGYPQLRALNVPQEVQGSGVNGIAAVQVVSFHGWGWGDEGSLLFVERMDGWYLWDYVPYACEELHVCGDIPFLELSCQGHGTGCYAKYIDVYNLSSRRIEAYYTALAYEFYQDAGIQAYGAASYVHDGLRVFRQLTTCTVNAETGESLPGGSLLDVFVYPLNDQGSLEKMETGN